MANMGLVAIGPWIAQLLVAIFFIVGFIDIYMSIWHTAFRTPSASHSKRILYRVILILLSVGVSSVLHFAGYESGNNAMMYHNIGLFILSFSLLDEDINTGEYSLRCVALIIVWGMHHMGDFTSQRFFISIAILLVMLVILRDKRKYFSLKFVPNIVASAIISFDFWLTLPTKSAGIQMDNAVAWEAILMFMLMTIFTWRQYHVAVRNNHTAHVANYDTMTDVKNYAAYQQDIFTDMGTARTNRQPLTLAVFDIDRFKQINDQYGHLGGNTVLTGISTLIKSTLQKYSEDYQLYRTGGEEFVIVFPNSTSNEVLPVLTHCWREVRNQQFEYNNKEIKVTTSMGMSSLRAEDESADVLYKRADDSLYDSKRRGRDTITVDGEEQELLGDGSVTYAYFVQNIYEVQSGIKHIANEMRLRCYDHEKETWRVPDQVNLTVDKRLVLMADALINSECKRIVITLSTAEFLNPEVAKKIINFRKSVDGPEELVIELDRMPVIDLLRRASELYHQNDITIVLSQIGNNRHFERVNAGIQYIDGIKLPLQSLCVDHHFEQIKDNIQFWGKIAAKRQIRFIVDGILDEKEANWVLAQDYVSYVEGDYFSRSHLPISA